MARRPTTPFRRRAGRPAGERGLTLAITLFAMATLLMAAATASFVGSAELHATRNYRGASQAHFVAESGISHAIQSVNSVGVLDFQQEVVDGWGNFLGDGARTFPGGTGYSYRILPIADAADPMNRGFFRATATGPDGTRNVVVARLLRSNIPSTAPGAIYLATDAETDADFRGNSWEIDGNDHLLGGGTGSGSPVPGLSTRSQANTEEALDSLGEAQYDNVQGLGYQAGPPTVPSVMTSPSAPTMDQLDEIIDTLIAQPPPIFQTNTSSQITGNEVFGTEESPRITYFPQSTEIKGAGTATGAGIMIVEGDLTIQGTLDFKGLIIVRGRTSVAAQTEGDTTVIGSATLYGSLWTYDVNLVVGGSAIVRYSTEALSIANTTVVTGALPAPVQVVSLADCAAIPAGTGGCP